MMFSPQEDDAVVWRPTPYVIQILSQPSQLSFSTAAGSAEDSVKGMGFPEYVSVRGLYSYIHID